MRYQRAEAPALLAGHEAARAFFASCFADCDGSRERLFVAHLDDCARCIALSEYEGDERKAAFPIRAILGEALKLGSSGVMLAHNHPSGDCRPSDSDFRSTRRLATAGEAMDVAVVDHLVFGRGTDCTSLRRLGFL